MFTVAQVSKWCEAQMVNAEEAIPSALFASLALKRLSTLDEAGPNDVAFFFSKHYQADLMSTRAGVIITGLAFVEPLRAANLPQWKSSIILACEDPYSSMARATAEVSKLLSTHDHQVPIEKSEIHPTAIIDPSVQLGKNVKIGAFSVLEAGVKIGDGAVIYPQCYLGVNSELGEGSVLFPKVTLYEKTVIGRHCRIHASTVIGGDGFGYAPKTDPETKLTVGHYKIYHLGRVVLEDDVEIGSGTTVDRGTFGDTIIRKGAKIDNQVQVGHNVEIGEGSVVCGCAGLAGSSSLGKFVIMGPQAGLANKVHIGDYSMMTSYSAATKDFPAHSEIGGYPARPMKEHYKILAIQQKLLRERGRKK